MRSADKVDFIFRQYRSVAVLASQEAKKKAKGFHLPPSQFVVSIDLALSGKVLVRVLFEEITFRR